MEGANTGDFVAGLATINGRMVALLRPSRLFGFDPDGNDFVN
jgi:hypothetical protein